MDNFWSRALMAGFGLLIFSGCGTVPRPVTAAHNRLPDSTITKKPPQFILYGVIPLANGIQLILKYDHPPRRVTLDDFRDMRLTRHGRQWSAILLRASVITHQHFRFPPPYLLVMDRTMSIHTSWVKTVEFQQVSSGVLITCTLFPSALQAQLLTSPTGFAWVFESYRLPDSQKTPEFPNKKTMGS